MIIKKRVHKNYSYFIYINSNEARKLFSRKVTAKIDNVKFLATLNLLSFRVLLDGTISRDFKIIIPMKIAKQLKLKQGQIKEMEIK